jgi:hypothetical protein
MKALKVFQSLCQKTPYPKDKPFDSIAQSLVAATDPHIDRADITLIQILERIIRVKLHKLNELFADDAVLLPSAAAVNALKKEIEFLKSLLSQTKEIQNKLVPRASIAHPITSTRSQSPRPLS